MRGGAGIPPSVDSASAPAPQSLRAKSVWREFAVFGRVARRVRAAFGEVTREASEVWASGRCWGRRERLTPVRFVGSGCG